MEGGADEGEGVAGLLEELHARTGDCGELTEEAGVDGGDLKAQIEQGNVFALVGRLVEPLVEAITLLAGGSESKLERQRAGILGALEVLEV